MVRLVLDWFHADQDLFFLWIVKITCEILFAVTIVCRPCYLKKSTWCEMKHLLAVTGMLWIDPVSCLHLVKQILILWLIHIHVSLFDIWISGIATHWHCHCHWPRVLRRLEPSTDYEMTYSSITILLYLTMSRSQMVLFVMFMDKYFFTVIGRFYFIYFWHSSNQWWHNDLYKLQVYLWINFKWVLNVNRCMDL